MKIQTLYIERAVADNERVKSILTRFPDANRIYCDCYSEIFNRKGQNFRLQKQRSALILAKKFKNQVLPAPKAYGLGAKHNYYFSHMLNCVYDCRYCFLQGMHRSAHYVLFVNYQDFSDQLQARIRQHAQEPVHFFSGYTCDSLAFEPVTGFTGHFLPLFQSHRNALLELRTKSTQIGGLLNIEPIDNVIVAFSLTPAEIARALEHKAPSLEKRLGAMLKLQNAGWNIGLRFDPLIYDVHFKDRYKQLFDTVFNKINPQRLHSVSLGGFRLPKGYFQTLQKLYPDELLLASPLEENNGMIGYQRQLETEMMDFCRTLLADCVAADKFFPCHETVPKGDANNQNNSGDGF